MIVPKIEEDYLFDLDDVTLQAYILFAKKVAKAIEKAVPCKRVGVAVIGLDVPHAHIHLVPLNSEADINFAKEKLKLAPEEMKSIAYNISFFV